MPFLQKLATAIIQNNSIDFKDTAVILPNRRAVKLLRQAMAQIIVVLIGISLMISMLSIL